MIFEKWKKFIKKKLEKNSEFHKNLLTKKAYIFFQILMDLNWQYLYFLPLLLLYFIKIMLDF